MIGDLVQIVYNRYELLSFLPPISMAFLHIQQNDIIYFYGALGLTIVAVLFISEEEMPDLVEDFGQAKARYHAPLLVITGGSFPTAFWLLLLNFTYDPNRVSTEEVAYTILILSNFLIMIAVFYFGFKIYGVEDFIEALRLN